MLKTIQQQQQQQQQLQQQASSFSSFNSASSRFLFDQFYAANESSSDPFATSAPSPSHFSMLSLDERRSRILSATSSNNNNNDSPLLSTSSGSYTNKPFLFHSNSSHSTTGGINIAQQQQSLHSIPEGSRSYRSYHHQHHYQQQQQQLQGEEEEDDVNDFMLPSSLNDLLTPNELLQQLQFPSSQSSSSNRQYEAQLPQWNVPFYINNTNGTGSYSYDESSPLQSSSSLRYQQPTNTNTTTMNMNNLSSGGSSSSNSNNNLDFIVDYPDEDGPFIMEDTVNQCIEPSQHLKKSTPTPNENYLTFNTALLKHH